MENRGTDKICSKGLPVIEIIPEVESSEDIKPKVENIEETKSAIEIIPGNQRFINIQPEYECHIEVDQKSQQETHSPVAILQNETIPDNHSSVELLQDKTIPGTMCQPNEPLPENYKTVEIVTDQQRLDILQECLKKVVKNENVEVKIESKFENKTEAPDDVTEYKQPTQAELAEVQILFRCEPMAEPSDGETKYEHTTQIQPEEVQTEYRQSVNAELMNDRTEAGPESQDVRMRRILQKVDDVVQDCERLLSSEAERTETLCSKVTLNKCKTSKRVSRYASLAVSMAT